MDLNTILEGVFEQSHFEGPPQTGVEGCVSYNGASAKQSEVDCAASRLVLPELHMNTVFSIGSNGISYKEAVQLAVPSAKGDALMIRISFIATTLAALVGITAAAPAMANDVSIEQYGWSNSAGGAQNGFKNRIRVYQDGRFNTVIGQQHGRHNLSAIGQEGVGNYGATYQNGNHNVAGVAQFGSNHTTILTQDGNGNIAAGVQVGHGCDANVSQGGSGNVAAFVQACP